MSNFMKIRPVGAFLTHAAERTDKRTDMKPIVVFRNFVNAPKNPSAYLLLKKDSAPCSQSVCQAGS